MSNDGSITLSKSKKVSKPKNILITGCSSGIGYYCAKKLKKDGYRVFATVRKRDDVRRLKKEGFEVYFMKLDDSKSIEKTLTKILKKSDEKIDILFNNAAYGQPGAVEDLSLKTLKEQFETNVFGTHYLTTQILKVMRRQGHGRIIQNSSVLGFVSLRFRGAYNASKYALEGLSDTLRLELQDTNIFVSLIEPGPVRSKFRENALHKFEENIDTENSFFKDEYKDKLKSLQSKDDVPFTLGEESVYKVLKEAIESKKPKARYRVTKPTTIFWFLKRVLSTNILDKILRKVD